MKRNSRIPPHPIAFAGYFAPPVQKVLAAWPHLTEESRQELFTQCVLAVEHYQSGWPLLTDFSVTVRDRTHLPLALNLVNALLELRSGDSLDAALLATPLAVQSRPCRVLFHKRTKTYRHRRRNLSGASREITTRWETRPLPPMNVETGAHLALWKELQAELARRGRHFALPTIRQAARRLRLV